MSLLTYRGFDIANSKTCRFFEANSPVCLYVLGYLLDRVWRDGASVKATESGTGGDIRFSAKYIYAEVQLQKMKVNLRLYDGMKQLPGLVTRVYENSAEKYDIELPIGTTVDDELTRCITASFRLRS